MFKLDRPLTIQEALEMATTMLDNNFMVANESEKARVDAGKDIYGKDIEGLISECFWHVNQEIKLPTLLSTLVIYEDIPFGQKENAYKVAFLYKWN